jgi:RecA-family ATPase
MIESIDVPPGVFDDVLAEFFPATPADEPPPVGGPGDFGLPDSDHANGAQRPAPARQAITPATFITPAAWPAEPPPAVLWLADHRIPRGDVSSLHGDGGAGKTDAALQLAEVCARGEGNWFGMAVMAGPVVILSAEEPEVELRRRIDRHGARDGFDPRTLTDLHLWFPSDVAGATLAVPDRSEIMQPTPLFRSIEARIKEIAPVLVVLDNVSAVYAGQQNSRVMVRSFVNLFRTIAHQPSRPAVLLLDHPSLSGMTNGTGRGGNMDWRNSVRSGHYLRAPDDKAEADRGVRLLETVKSNYGPLGKPVRLQWSDGGLALEGAQSPLRKIAQDQEADEVFLRLLDERNRIGLIVSPEVGRNYAPTIFEGLDGNGGYGKPIFARAMDRLLTADRIAVVNDGPPSRCRKRLVRAEDVARGAA